MAKYKRCLSCKQQLFSERTSLRDVDEAVEVSDIPWYCEYCVLKPSLQKEVSHYRHQINLKDMLAKWT